MSSLKNTILYLKEKLVREYAEKFLSGKSKKVDKRKLGDTISFKRIK